MENMRLTERNKTDWLQQLFWFLCDCFSCFSFPFSFVYAKLDWFFVSFRLESIAIELKVWWNWPQWKCDHDQWGFDVISTLSNELSVCATSCFSHMSMNCVCVCVRTLFCWSGSTIILLINVEHVMCVSSAGIGYDMQMLHASCYLLNGATWTQA